MASPKTLDLDAKYGAAEAVPSVPFKFLGAEWHVIQQFNTFAYGQVQAAGEDEVMGKFVDYIVSLVVEEERGAWGRALAHANLGQDRLQALVRDLTEVAAAPVPTQLPSGSSATPVTRVSRRKSTAS